MADANLLKMLDSEGKTGLKDLIIFGTVLGAVKTPSFVRSTIQDGFLAIMDVYAIRCNGVDYVSKYENMNSNLYFTKGRLLFVMNNASLIGKSVRLGGSSMKGATVKYADMYSKSAVAAFAWRKSGSEWTINPNAIAELNIKDTNGTALENYVVRLASGIGFSDRPTSVDSIMEFGSSYPYEMIESDNIEGGFDYVSGAEKVDVSKLKLDLKFNLQEHTISDYLDGVKEEVDEFKVKRENFIHAQLKGVRNLISSEEEVDLMCPMGGVSDDIRSRFTSKVISSYHSKLNTKSKMKGKFFVDELLENLNYLKFKGFSEESMSTKSYMALVQDIKNSLILNYNSLDCGDYDYIPVIKDSDRYATHILGVCTGIGASDLIDNYNYCYSNHKFSFKDWYFCLIRYPYLLGLLGVGLDVVSCDVLYFTITSHYSKLHGKGNYLESENMFTRDILRILEGVRGQQGKDTLVPIKSLNSRAVEWYSSKHSKLFLSNGLPISIDGGVAISAMYANREPIGVKKIEGLVNKSPMSKVKLDYLCDNGILDTINDDLLFFSDLYKEYIIYDKLVKKGNSPTYISYKQVEEVATEFEESVGFSLEPLQRKSIKLLCKKAGVLSGGPGSGKTTTCEGIELGITKYFSEYTICYAAPTGKAARRMAEVLGTNVKTIHSLFGVGMGSEPYFSNLELKAKNSSRVAYLLDEMAMCSVPLLYDIVKNLGEEDLVYFIGDIKQLSPIGRGFPFYTLMQILPCVELGTSKRAAEGSLINYNCIVLNFMSDSEVVELEYDDSTFIKRPCADLDLPKVVVNTFDNLLKGTMGKVYEEDDIQVITAYQTNTKSWSASSLNPLLQRLLRKNDNILFSNTDRDFYMNERIIHTKRNSYELRRYRANESLTLFEEQVTFGVVNGEMGKLVALVRSDMINVIPLDTDRYADEHEEELKDENSNESMLLEKYMKKVDDLRVDVDVADKDTYYAIMKTYDVSLKEDLYVLYRGNNRQSSNDEVGSLILTGGDLGYLDLAYALTTHKMQGSQCKAVVAPFGSSGSPSFVNRNMINTIISRSQEFVALIGDVEGSSSSITQGRRCKSSVECNDLLSILSV